MAEANPAVSTTSVAAVPLESRPGIFLVGSPNVGKRSILSRLLSIDLGDALESTDDISCHGWTIDTKYYSADVCIWTAQLVEGRSFGALPAANQLAALVLVFDLSDLSSFSALQDWVSGIDINRFEILLCIGNKADLLPGHFGHVEYRRHLQKRGESSSDPHPEFLEYGILEIEGTSLLGEEESSWEIRKSCLEWCIQHNIEYVEACGSNAVFDKCLSLNGDMQGVDRLYGALSAHMWPGMILKSGKRIAEPFPLEKEVETEESDDSEYEVEYEVLSGGFEEPWDDNNESWVTFSEERACSSIEEGSTSVDVQIKKPVTSNGTKHQISTSNSISDSAEVFGCDIHQERVVEESSACRNSLTTGATQEHRDVDESFIEPWDNYNESWVTFSEECASSNIEQELTSATVQIKKPETSDETKHQISASNSSLGSAEVVGSDIHQDRVLEESSACENPLNTGASQAHRDVDESFIVCGEVDEIPEETSNITEQQNSGNRAPRVNDLDDDMHLEYDDLERLMSEIGNMRGSLRLMPDFQRREMAAKLAMKMAVMFGCSSDEEGFE